MRFIKNTRNERGWPVGETHGKAKLSEEIVRKIRNSKQGYSTLAHIYGVGMATVRDAKKGYTWKHVK
jgi:hypothetical protein